jgi:hypothetical protein
MPEELPSQDGGQTHRPLFLTILCLITIIGSVMGIVQNTMGYFDAENKTNNIVRAIAQKIVEKQGAGSGNSIQTITGNLSNTLNTDNFTKFLIGGVFASLLTLIGAILMLKLKRNGFYSFALGTFFNIITLLLLFGENALLSGAFFYASLAGLGLLILLSFNIKYMD